MYAHGLYSAGILWPLWTVHLIVLVLELAVLTYLVLDWDAAYQTLPPGYTASMSLAFVNFVAEPLEYVLWSYHLLEPWVYLVLQILKAILWTVVVSYGLYELLAPLLILAHDWLYALIYTLLAVTLLSFYSSLAYAAFILHKSNKHAGYETPLDEKEQMAFRNSVALTHGRPKSTVSEQPLARSSVYTD